MIARLIRTFNDIKLRNKLVLSFILVVFIPVTIVGIYLTNEYRQMALRNAIAQNSNNVDRVKKRTAEILDVPAEISKQLLFDDKLMDLANTRYESVYDVVEAYRNYTEFQKALSFNKEISNIRFYMANPTLINNWQFMQPSEAVRQSFWYKQAVEGRGMIGWYFIPDETKNGQPNLCLVRRIDFLEYHSYGVLVIDVDANYLNSILSQETFETMIVDDNDYIISANRFAFSGKRLGDVGIPKQTGKNLKGTFETTVNAKPSTVMVQDIVPEMSLNGLRIVSVFNNDSIVKETNRISMQGLTVISISFAVALILIYAFSKLLSRRLLNLSKKISAVGKGNLDTMLPIDGKDEIGHLARQFNLMLASIKELMEEVHESHLQQSMLVLKQNEIKLKMMASQINPHFLFNALESIRMKAASSGEGEIAKTVRLLGKLMRKSLEIGGNRIPLKSEIDMVRCYLEIQKFRYEERLNYRLEIEPEAAEAEIPPLIIQPLVENAVIHGLEQRESGGEVVVTARLTGGELRVAVADNGEGADEEKVRELERKINEPDDESGGRIGLRNVHQRLQLFYGKEYGLRIVSGKASGFCVYFSMPVGREQDV